MELRLINCNKLVIRLTRLSQGVQVVLSLAVLVTSVAPHSHLHTVRAQDERRERSQGCRPNSGPGSLHTLGAEDKSVLCDKT